jgi:phytanoyl-CoA hydroxylase
MFFTESTSGSIMNSDLYTQAFEESGYFIVRQGFSQRDIQTMRARLEAIVDGMFYKDGRRFQSETDSGKYEDVEKAETGYRGPNVSYRKIADLEYDDLFLSKLQDQWIRDICTRFLGPVTSAMRVTMMDKPARGGTPLPWHQDVSLDWPTQVQPKLAIWFSLDEASAVSGSLEIIPGSHRNGVIGRGHILPNELETKYAPESKILTVETKPGDVLFFHAALLHRSGINISDAPRRAVNAILLPGAALHTRRNKHYPVLHGAGELLPSVVAQLTTIPT